MQVIVPNSLRYRFSLVEVMGTKIVPIITSYPALEYQSQANPC